MLTFNISRGKFSINAVQYTFYNGGRYSENLDHESFFFCVADDECTYDASSTSAYTLIA